VNGISAIVEINSTDMYGETHNALNLALSLPLHFRQLTAMSTAKQNFIYRMFQEKIPHFERTFFILITSIWTNTSIFDFGGLHR